MADQRPPFRFRLPWLPAAQPPRPTFSPRAPAQPIAATTQSQTTPQTTATQAPSQPSVTTTPRPTTPQTAATTQAPPQPSVTITPPPTTPQTAATQTPPQPSISTTPPPTMPQTAETQIPSQPSTTTTSAPATQTAETAALAQPMMTTRPTQTPTSPPKTEQSPTQKSSQPSASYTEVFSPSDKQEPKSEVSESLPLKFQPKTAGPEDKIHDSQDGAQPNEMTQRPSKESGMRAAEVFSTTEGPETPAVTQKSTTSTINGKPELLSKDMKPEEPKEVKEVMQGIKDKAHERARHMDSDLKGGQGQILQTKDLSTTPFQSEQAQKTIAGKEPIATSASNGKQTKIPTAPPRNKTMLADSQQKHRYSNGDHMPLHKEIRDDISKLVNKMAIGDSKHSTYDRPVSVITLAGENRGASMHVGFDSSKKEGSIHIRRGYKIKPDDSAEATTDGEENFRGQSDNPNAKEDHASEAYVNSNVQGINNSIIFNTSITERNPGVHLIHSRFPTESKKPSRKPELIETQKAEFNMTPSQKLTHEPTVRRRCLRGLFLESSDSDLDAAKPRRHGCRVGCNEKSKENIDVL